MLLQTKNLHIGYKHRVVQKNLNIQAHAGELICLIGTNGSGKSTLLKTLCGILKPLQGKVYIDEQDMSLLDMAQRCAILSVVLTDAIEVENMRVYDLVALGRFPHTNWIGKLSSKDQSIILRSIEQVNMDSKTYALLNEISDGEKQRAVIAKALTQDTPFVLLDEPTAHLDIPNRIDVLLLLKRLSIHTSKTFILATHELDLAIQMADRIWIMSDQGIEEGIPEDLMWQGKIQQLFSHKSLLFDPQTGRLMVKTMKGNMQVYVTGDPLGVLWLTRACNRCAIGISEHADIGIYAHPSQFTIHHPTKQNITVKSIADVLKHLYRLGDT